MAAAETPLRLDPQLRALRGDDAPQRVAQAALFAARDDWRGDPGVAPLLDEFARYGEGEPLGDRLATVTADAREGRRLVARFLARLLPALAQHPLGQVPLRHFSDGKASTLMLAQGGRAMLVLAAREPGSHKREAITFSDGERRELVLAGRAEARIVRLHPGRSGTARLEQAAIALGEGVTVSLAQARENLTIDRAARRLVTLRLLRTAEAPQPVREYRLADGALLHQAAGAIGESRTELMFALLGRMRRRDAAPAMADLALGQGSAPLRWQALRECLALDSGTGFRALSAVAGDPADPLAEPAGALRAQLLEAHPQLQQVAA